MLTDISKAWPTWLLTQKIEPTVPNRQPTSHLPTHVCQSQSSATKEWHSCSLRNHNGYLYRGISYIFINTCPYLSHCFFLRSLVFYRLFSLFSFENRPTPISRSTRSNRKATKKLDRSLSKVRKTPPKDLIFSYKNLEISLTLPLSLTIFMSPLSFVSVFFLKICDFDSRVLI